MIRKKMLPLLYILRKYSATQRLKKIRQVNSYKYPQAEIFVKFN